MIKPTFKASLATFFSLSLKPQDRGSFLERYIHCFFNCIGRQIIMINKQPIHLEATDRRMFLDSIIWELMAKGI